MSFIASGIAASVAAGVGLGTSALAVGATAAALSAVAGAGIGAAGSAIMGGDPGEGALMGAASGALGGALGGAAAGAGGAAAGAGSGAAGGLSSGASSAASSAVTPALTSASTVGTSAASAAPSMLGSAASSAVTPALSQVGSQAAGLTAQAAQAAPSLLGNTGGIAATNAITPALANAPTAMSAGIGAQAPTLLDMTSDAYSYYKKGEAITNLADQNQQQDQNTNTVNTAGNITPTQAPIESFSSIAQKYQAPSLTAGDGSLNLSGYQQPTSLLGSPGALPSSKMPGALQQSTIAKAAPSKMAELGMLGKINNALPNLSGLSDDQLTSVGAVGKGIAQKNKPTQLAQAYRPPSMDANDSFLSIMQKGQIGVPRLNTDNQVSLLSNRYFS